MRFRNSIFLAAALLIISGAAAHGEEPALPAGLGGTEEQKSEPALPAGLGGTEEQKSEPALPAGLGGSEEQKSEPALPAGLEGEAENGESTAAGEKPSLRDRLNLNGFVDLRGGLRTRHDPAWPRDAMIGEARLQVESEKAWEKAVFDTRMDFIGDGVLEEGDYDLRQARLTWSVSDRLDLRIGRQVLTWGTGDMLFINDLFPKDWQSYFTGRDVEYLKAPSDALRIGWFPGPVNIDFTYTPQFAHDRFIRGERVSFYNPMFGRFDGRDRQADWNAPSDWFSDDEFALRVYRRAGRWELAAYGYSGYWKSPGGQRLVPFMQARFPKLAVYGASIRGTLGPGIFNAEAGYYDSRQDRHGTDMLINNSEFRILLGYEQDIAKNFTAALQWYLEHMMDYSAYENSMLFWLPRRDKDRHVFTLRLTRLLMQQNLTLSFFGYWSPTDGDAYLRPNIQYKLTDRWRLETGGNIFMGESDASFFGQFKYNTNIYGAVRYSF
jgi:hypothetical protein